ncbi:hypothetical protein C0989_011137 [Termitomyces sp. Mn162]|nr:hypothetical protein C0989_011137 [Termitomyces sp. Mn162]
MDRADACAYDDKQQKSRTMLLKEQIFQLERHLHDLESSSGSGSSSDRFHEPFQPGNEPHPALVNAIYLLACHFANSQIYTDLEFPFYTQTQHEINVALDTSDRLPDIVQASALLAIYLFMNNRVMEGYRHTFSAIKLAVGTGLHQIQPQSVMTGIYPAHAPLIPILPPRDAMELQDRILVFWQIFTIDRCWSAANSLPLALSDQDTPQCRILTPWPLEASKWDAIGFQPPLRAFFDGAELSDPSEETIPSLKAKAAVLYELTSRSKDGTFDGSLARTMRPYPLSPKVLIRTAGHIAFQRMPCIDFPRQFPPSR